MSAGPLRVLEYHRVLEPSEHALDYRGVISASPAEFERQMRFLSRHYRVVSAEEVVEALHGRRALPARAVLVTFDDGYRDFGTVAWPIMRHYGLPATVFVPTASPDEPTRRLWWDRLAAAFALAPGQVLLDTPWGRLRLDTPERRAGAFRTAREQLKGMDHAQAMALVEDFCAQLGEPRRDDACFHTWAELRELAASGVTIAAHTRTHPALTRLPPEAARAEIRGAREDLLRQIGTCLPIFCYPFGDHDDRVAALVGEEGFELAVTCRAGHNRLPLREPLRLCRTSIGLRTTLAVFRARLTPVGSYLDSAREARNERRRRGRVALEAEA